MVFIVLIACVVILLTVKKGDDTGTIVRKVAFGILSFVLLLGVYYLILAVILYFKKGAL